MIHFDNPEAPVGEIIDGLEELKKEGKIIEYGIGHMEINRLKEYVSEGNIDNIMMEYSIDLILL